MVLTVFLQIVRGYLSDLHVKHKHLTNVRMYIPKYTILKTQY